MIAFCSIRAVFVSHLTTITINVCILMASFSLSMLQTEWSEDEAIKEEVLVYVQFIIPHFVDIPLFPWTRNVFSLTTLLAGLGTK